MTTEQLASALGISKRAVLKQIDKLKVQCRLSRVGPARGGHWEVIA
ncbi:HTH domain-containing protein [Chlorobium sp. KB01]